MSLLPGINFPINFCFWEGSSPSSKETKGRREEKGGGGRRERKTEGGLYYPSPSTGHLVPPPASMPTQTTRYGLNICVPLKFIC